MPFVNKFLVLFISHQDVDWFVFAFSGLAGQYSNFAKANETRALCDPQENQFAERANCRCPQPVALPNKTQLSSEQAA